MALTVLDEWRLAHRMESFAAWLEQGDETIRVVHAQGKSAPAPDGPTSR